MSGNLGEDPTVTQSPQKIAVIHWFPVEYYPPATNCLDYLATQSSIDAHCYTSTDWHGRVPYDHQHVDVVRFPAPSDSGGRMSRMARYLWFPIATFLHLMRLRPDCVLYYEPQSSLPAMLYASISWRCRIMIHHHEYHDPEQFLRPGMRLVRLYHWLEKRFFFNRAVWISHTNDRRLELFHADHPSIDPGKLKVLANYPPATWREKSSEARNELRDMCDEVQSPDLNPPSDAGEAVLLPSNRRHLSSPSQREGEAKRHARDGCVEDKDVDIDSLPREEAKTLRLVYVGSVSLHDTYIGPLVDWILSRPNGNVKLDVFAYNADKKTKAFLSEASLKTPRGQLETRCRVRYFEQGVQYDELPDVLASYDVGVILYRCNTTNYKFNASNKLFEYMACGLEVWYPPQMLGVKPYERSNAQPRVIEVDYDRLDELDVDAMAGGEGLPPATAPPCCEDEFESLVKAMLFAGEAPPSLAAQTKQSRQ